MLILVRKMNAVLLTFSVLGKRCVVVLPAALEREAPANDAQGARPPMVSGVYRVAKAAADEGDTASYAYLRKGRRSRP